MSLGDWFIFGLNEHFSGMDIPIYLRASVCIFLQPIYERNL